MALLQSLKSFVNERLSAAAEEICELVERIITEYEVQAFSSKRQIEHYEQQQRLLPVTVVSPDIRLLHTTDVLHLPVCKEEVSVEQQERNPSLVQEEPGPPQIKEEQQESDTEDGDEQEENLEDLSASNTLKSHNTQNVEGQRLSSSNKKDPESSKQAPSMWSHTGGKLFKCTHCGEVFGLMCHLKMHMRTHAAEKPFNCTFCSKGFDFRSALTTHMRSHTGEKPFTCAVCKKSFNRNYHLKTHMRVHTKAKLVCAVCAKGFAQMSDLETHMRAHIL